MCGIAGLYDRGGVDVESVRKMTESLRHRGPDAGAVVREGPCALGHRRLSILDLSEAANQPFYSQSGRYLTAYNGEVYNYRELGRAYNLQLRTTTDTEVVVELFSLLGPDFVELLNGMFAIAIYDTLTEKLFLFRDRLGIKPLFYGVANKALAFASELKAFRSIDRAFIDRLSVASIGTYLNLGYIPGPNTIYESVKRLGAGTWACFDGNSLEVTEYWSVENALLPTAHLNEVEALEKMQDIVVSAVQSQMVSDVPFGAFLSGGIDSSLITAVAQSLSSGKLSTFSVSFEDDKFDEGPYARNVAQFLGTDHHEFVFQEADALELLADVTNIYDEPYADTSAAPTMWLSSQARKSVTMVLAGDGGDELFLGYGSYAWAARLDRPIFWGSRKLLAAMLDLGNQRMRRVAELLRVKSRATFHQHIFSQEQYFFSESDLEQVLSKNCREEVGPLVYVPRLERNCSAAERQALFDLKYYLPDDLLTKVDRASMRCGLEARVPLLDHRLVEFALNLTPELRRKGKTSKYLLKKLLYRYVPERFFLRPKRGFSIPLASWLRGGLCEMTETYLAPELTRRLGILQPQPIVSLKERFWNGETRLAQRLWALITLQKWMSEGNFTAP